MTRKNEHPSKEVFGKARALRERSTFPERLLWSRLRHGGCAGLKFRRQQPIGGYVVDFFCPEAALIVELDGRSHEGRGHEDDRRQDDLLRQGYRVIRFTNDEVLRDLQAVVESIFASCASSTKRGDSEGGAPPGDSGDGA